MRTVPFFDDENEDIDMDERVVVGRTYGVLYVMELKGSTALCKCQCLSEIEVDQTMLHRGRVRSCAACAKQEHKIKKLAKTSVVRAKIIRARINKGWSAEQAAAVPMPTLSDTELVRLAKEHNLEPAVVLRRLQNGHTWEKALAPRVNVKQLAQQHDISDQVVRHRVQQGWPLEKALTVPVRGHTNVRELLRAKAL